MNHQQKKYAINRIEALKTIKLRQAEEKFTTKEVALSPEEKYKLIASGKVKIKSWVEVYRNHYNSPDLFPSYDFSAFEKPRKLDEVKYNAVKENVCSISQKATDQIMLGDCQEALKLINELENIKV